MNSIYRFIVIVAKFGSGSFICIFQKLFGGLSVGNDEYEFEATASIISSLSLKDEGNFSNNGQITYKKAIRRGCAVVSRGKQCSPVWKPQLEV